MIALMIVAEAYGSDGWARLPEGVKTLEPFELGPVAGLQRAMPRISRPGIPHRLNSKRPTKWAFLAMMMPDIAPNQSTNSGDGPVNGPRSF